MKKIINYISVLIFSLMFLISNSYAIVARYPRVLGISVYAFPKLCRFPIAVILIFLLGIIIFYKDKNNNFYKRIFNITIVFYTFLVASIFFTCLIYNVNFIVSLGGDSVESLTLPIGWHDLVVEKIFEKLKYAVIFCVFIIIVKFRAQFIERIKHFIEK